MSMLLKRLAAPLLMLAWAVYYFLQVSRQNPQSQYLIRPVFYVICVIFAVIAAGEISRLRKEQKSAGGVGAPAIPISDQVRALLKNKVALFMLTTLIYLLVMQLLGFILSTAFYLFFGFLALKAKPVTSVILSVGLSLAVYCVFKMSLGVPLPAGFLGF